MTPKIILCPGQGAQAIGMAKAWHNASAEARAVFDQADDLLKARLGAPLSELCFSGPADRLNQTDVAQPALYVAGVASFRGLLAQWGCGAERAVEECQIVAAAGLSLGEYTALHIAGSLTFEDGLELVTLRGRAMQDAATAVPSGMVALIGADEAQAAAVCERTLAQLGPRGVVGEILVPANYNAPGQVVISGSKAACEQAVAVAGEMGLRATPLPVAGAFHSPIMRPAAERLAAALAKTSIRAPRCPVFSNVTAKPHAGSDGVTLEESIRRRLVEQLTSPVRWAESCVEMTRTVQGEYHELAPGKTLAGLMRRIERSTKVETHDEPPPPVAPPTPAAA